MHLTKFSLRLIALLAVIAAVLVAFSGVGPGAPREASATDKNMELEFFQLNNATWDVAQVKTMLGIPTDILGDGTANGIWSQAGITFSWPKQGAGITVLADPQPAVGAKGNLKEPPSSPTSHIKWDGSPLLATSVGSGTDPKIPTEASKACLAANEIVNPNQFPVILIEQFVDVAGSVLGSSALAVTLGNPSALAADKTDSGLTGNQIGAGLCILIEKDAKGFNGKGGEVLAHELGHAMCLPHDTDEENLMHATALTMNKVVGDQIVQKGVAANAMLCNKKVQDKLKLDLTGTSCSDIWLDISALIAGELAPLGKPHDPTGDLLVGKALTRIEPSQKQKGAWDITTVSYLGPEVEGFEPPQTQFDFALGELIPDVPPTKLDCQQKASVVDGTAQVTNHKLTWQDDPPNDPPPWNRVDVFVKSNGEVKNMLFTCQNSGEKVLVDVPKDKEQGVSETWSADFVQKCITENTGVDLVVNWVGAASDVLNAKCIFSNANPPSVQPCDVSNTPPVAKDGAEKGIMNPDVKFSAVTNKRPTSTSKIVNELIDLDNNPGTPDVNVPVLTSSGCSFSEASKQWIRIDTKSTLINSGPGAKNVGTVVLFLGTSSPSDPNDGTTCKILDDGPGGAEDTITFPSILETHSRDASTDHPDEPKNDPLITDGTIVLDPDGPNQPKMKDVPQVQDTNDGLQDDWDGDGCPDWDEMDKDFINGRDPFNPTDCNTKDDYTGTYNILATVAPAAKEGVLTGTIAKVKVVTDKVIKDDKHIQVDLLVSNLKGQSLKNNQKIYWDTDDPLQEGWWQVKQGSIIEGGIQPTATPAQTDKSVTLNRLFAPPCGTTIGVPPEVAAPAEGQLVGVQCVGDVQEGSYFHCIARIDETPDNELNGNVVCYIDSGGLSSLPPVSAVPSFADGNAGPPPPPPYGTAAPNELSGTFDKVNQRIIIEVCFANVGGFLGPNVVVRANVDANSLKGFANIWRSRSNAECDAQVSNAGEPFLQVEVVFARQNINFDHDEDGCSDYDELGHGKTPPPAKKNCGDDPYNPYDSDTDFSGPSSTLATAIRADACSKGVPIDPCAGVDEIAGNEDDLADKTVVPGVYFHCLANNIATGVNTYDTPLYCYIDIPGVLVNPEASLLTGDGLPGSPPPLPYGDVDTAHSVLSTVYDKQTNRLLTVGCIDDLDGEGALGNVYVALDVDAHTGLGTVDIFVFQPAGCTPAPTGTPSFIADVETAEQPPDWDSDGDGCTDAQELGPFQSAGGLRDPFNQWDLLDTWATGSQTRNVDGFDIGDVVVRFGQVGDPTGDPHEEPTANNNYHTAADRTSPILGANPWNLPAPSGNIDGFDIGAVVVQFGHTCVQ